MKIGLWNLDHPEFGSPAKQKRVDAIVGYLETARCDTYILTEANSAIELANYSAVFSDESPFIRTSRSYKAPNSYHQVAIYSRKKLTQQPIKEPINGALCKVHNAAELNLIYANVITIKDQWKKDSLLKYSNRLDEQMDAMSTLPNTKTLIAGDYNLKAGWPAKAGAFKKMEIQSESQGWVWPTKQQRETVQHVLHTADLHVDYFLDRNVNNRLRLSDHPFMTVTVNRST